MFNMEAGSWRVGKDGLDSAVETACSQIGIKAYGDIKGAARKALEGGARHYVVVGTHAISVACSGEECEVRLYPLAEYIRYYGGEPGGRAVWHVGTAEVAFAGAAPAELYRSLQRYLALLMESSGRADNVELLNAFDAVSKKLDEVAAGPAVAFIQGREVEIEVLSKVLDAPDPPTAMSLCTAADIGGGACKALAEGRDVFKRALGYAGVQHGDAYVLLSSQGAFHIRGYKNTMLVRKLHIVEFIERHLRLGDAAYYIEGRDYRAKAIEDYLLLLRAVKVWLQRVGIYGFVARAIDGKIRAAEELIAYELERDVRAAASLLLRKIAIAIKAASTYENKDVAEELVERVVEVAESVAKRVREKALPIR